MSLLRMARSEGSAPAYLCDQSACACRDGGLCGNGGCSADDGIGPGWVRERRKRAHCAGL